LGETPSEIRPSLAFGELATKSFIFFPKKDTAKLSRAERRRIWRELWNKMRANKNP